MKVRAGPGAKSGMFPAGDYVVLGLRVSPRGELRFIVEESPETPALFAPGEIVLTDNNIPPSWKAGFEDDGEFWLEPVEWSAEFWDAYENGDPAAWEIYRKVKERVEKESA